MGVTLAGPPAPLDEWAPWACTNCAVPLTGVGPLSLCQTDEQAYQRTWAPAGITRDEAVAHAAIELDLLASHAHLARGLNGSLTRHSPAIDLDVHAHVADVLRRNTVRVTARTVVVRLSPDDVRELRGLSPQERDAVVHRVACGTQDYRCPAVAGLVWQLSGVEAAVANRFEERMRERTTTPGGPRCQPTNRDEVVEAPHLHPLLAWSAARDWQRHLTEEPAADLAPATLDEIANQVERSWAHFRRPASVDAYRQRNFSDQEASAWHRLLVRTGAVTPGQGAADTAASWRDHGFDHAALLTWIGTPPLLFHGRSAFQRDPDRHAALRDVGFPALTDALPWLEMWDRQPQVTAAQLFEHWRTGTPLEWAESYASSQKEH